MVAGQRLDDLWSLTLREVDLVIEAAGDVLDREHDERVWLAFTLAGLMRAKKLPDHERYLSRRRQSRPKPRQAWKSIEAMLDSWVNN